MWKQAHSAYMESRILTADPMELVRLMYQAAIGEVRKARERLEAKDIAGRAAAIAKACDLITELNRALDRQNGGDYAGRLAELYAYMMRRLSEANFRQFDEPLAEVLSLLTTLLEGWEGAQQQLERAGAQAPLEETRRPPESTRSAFSGAEWAQRPESGHASRAWSF